MSTKFPKKHLQAILDVARSKPGKLTAPIADNVTMQTVLKTNDCRIDVHKVNNKPDERVAKIQANTEAKSSSVKKWIRDAKQPGHAGTHKNISVIKYNVKDFDFGDFENEANEQKTR